MKLIPAILLAVAVLASSAGSVSAQGNFLDSIKGKIGDIVPKGMDTGGATASVLSNSDIVAGLREALKVGAERVTGQVGKVDGYNADPDIHIPLPESLQKVQSTLRRFGLSGMADDVELKLNRAAEAAAPQAKKIFWDAVTEMNLDDAKSIYDGPKDAATKYFERTTSASLKSAFRPVVDESLSEVGAIASYDNLMGKYRALPFVPDVKANLSEHTVNLALKGLFLYLAKEEAAIRENPAKRTTDLLAKVFGR